MHEKKKKKKERKKEKKRSDCEREKKRYSGAGTGNTYKCIGGKKYAALRCREVLIGENNIPRTRIRT